MKTCYINGVNSDVNYNTDIHVIIIVSSLNIHVPTIYINLQYIQADILT
jgi:hypothetical protein